ncbi:MAG: muramoyltetrapeptide carboxypeptidase [Actinomycetota bacterium]|nr:muramoyltetrapeptide carboxypeptidase [Actinomycetota bacterium]
MTEPALELRRPPRLRPGDRVWVVAPSGPVDPARLDRGCAELESWGLQVVRGEHVLDRDRYLAGRDVDRAADLQAAWCDPTAGAVFCARGGSGATRLLGLLDWRAMGAAPPKVLVGYSDITALQEGVATHLGLTSLFGPMPAAETFAGEAPDRASIDHLRRTLFAPEQVQVLHGGQTTCVNPGTARGATVGGTLALLAGSIGTPESRPAAGRVVVLEDITEPAYRIDNLLTQLLRTGWFDGVQGIVLGSWVDCGDDAVETICERLAPLGVPMISGMPFGHAVPQLTVPLGVPAELDADAGTLTMTVPALE